MFQCWCNRKKEYKVRKKEYKEANGFNFTIIKGLRVKWYMSTD